MCHCVGLPLSLGLVKAEISPVCSHVIVSRKYLRIIRQEKSVIVNGGGLSNLRPGSRRRKQHNGGDRAHLPQAKESFHNSQHNEIVK